MKKYLTLLLLLISSLCIFAKKSSKNQYLENEIFGEWRCVRVTEWRVTKYDYNMRDSIEKENLIIDRNRISLSHKLSHKLGFIEPCEIIANWEIRQWDTSAAENFYLFYNYPKKELVEIIIVEGLDKNNRLTYCDLSSKFYIKQDTLIHNCGGFLFYRIKIDKKK